jgi:hypothetical protein
MAIFDDKAKVASVLRWRWEAGDVDICNARDAADIMRGCGMARTLLCKLRQAVFRENKKDADRHSLIA